MIVGEVFRKTKRGFAFTGPCGKHQNNLIVHKSILLADRICVEELGLPGKYFSTIAKTMNILKIQNISREDKLEAEKKN